MIGGVSSVGVVIHLRGYGDIGEGEWRLRQMSAVSKFGFGVDEVRAYP